VGEKPEEKNLALLVRQSSVAISPETDGGKISMKIKIKMECSFDEENSAKNYFSDLGVKRIESFANSTLRERVQQGVQQVQTEFGCDIFGFGRKIYQEKPKEWQKLKPSWRETFRTVSVKIEPDVSIVNAQFAQPKGHT
jgi:spore germination protein KC